MNQSAKLVIGNWKMNGLGAQLAEAEAVRDALEADPPSTRVGLCPPATLIAQMASALQGGPVEIGGQDCHAQAFGACTGSISAEMLADAGARLVILGHSERRTAFGETDRTVAAKVEAAVRAGLEPIICVGETFEQREASQTISVVTDQVHGSLPSSLADQRFALAYEPVWAIGTGRTPTPEQIEEVHVAIRTAVVDRLSTHGLDAPILYGGSVTPGNAAEILALSEVGGALVGGASLKSADFLAIIRAA